ncbi:MAG: glycoside hydrolase family 127 protein, partial [Bacteroidaceae bacterium]|nr:glycoside hydrolase family 127 protein [Bacteroidaceae bacterium]
MKKIIISSLLAIWSTGSILAQSDKSGYPITPVPFTAVKVTPNTFWGQRLQASRDVTIPLAFSKCESEHRYDNFTQAAQHIKDPSKVFQVDGVMGYSFDDTDPYKTLEGAAYLMQTHPNAKINGEPIDKYCDKVIAIIASAQEPDGYLYTARTQNPEHPHGWAGTKRWEKVEDLS